LFFRVFIGCFFDAVRHGFISLTVWCL
jgi:hypothetical protein